MSKHKPKRERAIPVSELKREALRLIAEGKMPTLAELLRAISETKKELTIKRTKMVQ